MLTLIKRSWSNDINFRQNRLESKEIIRDKDRCFTIKRQILKEDITVLNVYVPSNRASKYMKYNRQSCKEKSSLQ